MSKNHDDFDKAWAESGLELQKDKLANVKLGYVLRETIARKDLTTTQKIIGVTDGNLMVYIRREPTFIYGMGESITLVVGNVIKVSTSYVSSDCADSVVAALIGLAQGKWIKP